MITGRLLPRVLRHPLPPHVALSLCRSLPQWRRRRCGMVSEGGMGLAKRFKSYHFYINVDDPEETQRHVTEAKVKLEQDGLEGTTAYLHQELNEVLGLYQSKQFIEAHAKVEKLHDKVIQSRSSSSLPFFTAQTACYCCAALADAYEEHLRWKEEHWRHHTSLSPSPSVVFRAERAIEKLRTDAQRYRAIAHRIQNRPGMEFLRTVHPKRAQPPPGSSRSNSSADHHSTHGAPSRSSGVAHRCEWEETTQTVDDDYQPYYGTRYQERRRRPEFKERRQRCVQQSLRYPVQK